MNSAGYDGSDVVAGVDEAGRGPLAGPVMAAAVVLDPDNPIAGLADSKALSAKQRQALAAEIRLKCRAWCVAAATVTEIDQMNILQATLLAMRRAVAGLGTPVTLALIDGNQSPDLPCRIETIVKGDQTVPAISAASILAKVERDEQMVQLHGRFPEYGFSVHKGYPTPAHLAAIEKFGICPVHRRSFGPVKRAKVNMFYNNVL